jgi:dephospho-CoA kinase
VLLVGLTGGIGSGKSTVAAMLASRGAVVIDADDLARSALEPGTHGYAEVLRRFGPPAVSLRGDLDREWLASKVFADPEARRQLEGIVHPEVASLFRQAVEPYRDTDRVVVYSVPLLLESELQSGFDLVLVVSASESVRVARLTRDRAMSEEDVRRRMAAQASDAERERIAHVILRNDGTPSDLEAEVDRAWQDLQARARI